MKARAKYRDPWPAIYANLLMLAGVVLMVFGCASAFAAQGPDMRFNPTKCHAWHGGLGAQGSFSECEMQVVAVPYPVDRIVTVREPAPAAPVPPVASTLCPPPAVASQPPLKPRYRPKPKPVDCLK